MELSFISGVRQDICENNGYIAMSMQRASGGSGDPFFKFDITGIIL